MFLMPRAYAPVTILVDERSDGVHLTYDQDGQPSWRRIKIPTYSRSPGTSTKRSRTSFARRQTFEACTGVCTDRAAGSGKTQHARCPLVTYRTLRIDKQRFASGVKFAGGEI